EDVQPEICVDAREHDAGEERQEQQVDHQRARALTSRPTLTSNSVKYSVAAGSAPTDGASVTMRAPVPAATRATTPGDAAGSVRITSTPDCFIRSITSARYRGEGGTPGCSSIVPTTRRSKRRAK